MFVVAAVFAANTAAAARCFCAKITLSGIAGGAGGFGIFNNVEEVFMSADLQTLALTLVVFPSEPGGGADLSDEEWGSTLTISPEGFCGTKKKFSDERS